MRGSNEQQQKPQQVSGAAEASDGVAHAALAIHECWHLTPAASMRPTADINFSQEEVAIMHDTAEKLETLLASPDKARSHLGARSGGPAAVRAHLRPIDAICVSQRLTPT